MAVHPVYVIFIIVASLVIIGNPVIMGFFAWTNVGLTPDEQLMLAMTSSQINQLFTDSCAVLVEIQSIQNYTDELLVLKNSLDSLQISQSSLNASVISLNETSNTQRVAVILYNSTIDDQLAVLQPKIDNVTIPNLDLMLQNDTVIISNGTVLLSNPNDRLENTTLTYLVKKQLNNTIVEIGQPGDNLVYQTLGASNWVSLIDWAPALFVSSGIFTVDQVLDAQRDVIDVTPPIGTREYNGDEIKLVFDGLLVANQTITIVSVIQMNVGLI